MTNQLRSIHSFCQALSSPLHGAVTAPARLAAVAGLVGLLGLVSGCKSDPNADVSFDAIRKDLTPEMGGMYQRKVIVDKDIALNFNQGFLAAADDWGRVWYTDAPSSLSPYTPVKTAGTPR